jgi:F420-non-reducing hydrogenase large subunit
MAAVKEFSFEALRFREEPARIRVFSNPERPLVLFQITAPRDVTALCLGRAVEELPRILTILSPAHHLASALALDALFNVEPPPLAKNMRQGLLQALFFENHLRKIFFLVSSRLDPWAATGLRPGAPPLPSAPRILEEILSHLSLAREASAILGGRVDHPLSAVAGGVSRFLKEENYARLSRISESCLAFSRRLADFLEPAILGEGEGLLEGGPFSPDPLSLKTFSKTGQDLVLRDGQGQELDRFPPDRILEKIGLHQEPWSYEPFAYLTGSSGGPELKDRIGVSAFSRGQCFLVGPLARLIRDAAIPSPAGEAHLRPWKTPESRPSFDLSAAYGSLVVELLQAAEKMAACYKQENLTGPTIRTIPTEMGREGRAVLESPKGLIYHHYRVNEKGRVTDITVLDTLTMNNTFYALLAQKAVETALGADKTPPEIKALLEWVLLPF